MPTVDADGTVVLLGRGSTSINTGGEKVYPEEVETALMTCPEVADVVVVGLPDERWGQRVVAVVAAAPGASRTSTPCGRTAPPRSRATSCRAKLVLVDTVERTPAGKADYAWARATAEAHHLAS